MKSSVAVTLIVCGSILVAMPYVHNAIVMHQLSNIITALNKTVNLTGDIPKYASIASVFGGIVMILLGAFSRGRSEKAD